MGNVVELAKRRMPPQKPGKSKQDYATPKVLIDAIKRRFDITRFEHDLAADALNTKADSRYFDEETDSLKQDWMRLHGDLWLNPPFADIAPWAAKCAKSAPRIVNVSVRRIFFLVPAAVGSNWWARHVDKKARVIFLNGRIPFMPDKPKWGYPKDCALILYGEKPGYEIWRWRGEPLR